MMIYCCGCSKDIDARLTDGKSVYPHRPDLYDFPFWICDKCGNFVGCHHKTKDRTNPLGVIATKEIKNARLHIHELLDPLWKSGKITRRRLYRMIMDKIGKEFHVSHIKSIDEAREIYKLIKSIKLSLDREVSV